MDLIIRYVGYLDTYYNNSQIYEIFRKPQSVYNIFSANEKTANRNERKALTERIAFYDAVLDILTRKSAEPVSAAEETDVAKPQTEVETTTETTSFTPGLVEDEYTAKLSKKRRKALNDVAVALGVRVRFVDAVRTAAGGLANADITGNEVRIAWSKRDKAISFLVGHEFTHRMQELSPKEYASFKESVKAYMGDERWNALVAKTRSIYEAHNAREMARADAEHRAPRLLQYSVELIEDEVVADFAGELNEDANALAAFAEKLAEKPSTLKAVIAVLRDILNKLKGLVAGAEAQRLANMLSKFEELYRASASRTTEGQTQSKEKYSLSDEQAAIIIEAMKANAVVAPQIELTPENWVAEFGAEGVVSTPIGEVIMGEHQYKKLVDNKRNDDFGKVKPTLTNPDIVLEEYDPKEGALRDTKYLFIKTFTKQEENMRKAQYELSAEMINDGYDGVIVHYPNDFMGNEYIAFEPNQIKSAEPVTYDDNGNVIPLSERFNFEKEDIRYSIPSQPIFYSNAEYAVRGIKQEKATPEQWLKMIEKNGGLKAGEDKWLGLSDWLKASDKKTITKDEVLQYIAENDIQIEEVEYAQFGPGLIDEATRKLEAEMREIGIEAMREKYDGFDDLFEVYNGELLWSEERASEGEYEDFIIENNIVDVNAQANAINETRLGYTTNGLDNKREIALTVPTIEPWNTSDNIHFGDAGEGRAVAWVRFGETTDADGRRVLVIDEIQSKRHQEGREKGYNNPRVIEIFTRLAEIESNLYSQGISMEVQTEREALKAELESIFEKENPVMKSLAEQIDEKKSKRTELIKEKMNEDEERAEIYRLREKQNKVRNVRDYDYYEAEISEIEDRIEQRHEDIDLLNSNIIDLQLEYSRLYNNEVSNARVGVSPAPFEKNWAELAMKRMLRYAAENGFDKVAWTTGDQQADRYDIGSVVSRIVSYTEGDVTNVSIKLLNNEDLNLLVDADGKVVKSNRDTGAETLADVVGKELATKVLNNEGEDVTIWDGKDIPAKQISGDGLRIGGEGMKAFYDQMLPSFVRKYAKKWGATVSEVTMPDLEKNNTMHSVDVTPAMRESVMQGQPKFSLRDAETEKIFTTAKEKFGTTYDMREAGYILPDGSMLDFSGKHEVRDTDTSFLNGRRTVDHREIENIAYDFDENETGVKTDLGDFLDRGAIRIDYNAGAINLNIAPTRAQKDRLKRLIERNDGYVYIDFGKGWDTEHYAEYEAARATRVLGDIDRYFDEGIKPTGNVRFSLSEVNDRFNEELQMQIDGTLPQGHIYKLGMPSDILRSAGIPGLPIELAASRLTDKSMQENHPFELSEVENLPIAIHNPLVVFRSATHIGSNVILTELKHNGRSFVIALETNKQVGKLLVNSVRSVHYRTDMNILNWLNEDLADYIKPTFEQEWFIPTKNKLLSQPQYNSADVRKKLNDVAKVIQNFENPKIEPKNSLRVRRLSMPMPDDIFFDDNGDIISFSGDDVREATTIVRRAPKTTEERIKMYMESRHYDSRRVSSGSFI